MSSLGVGLALALAASVALNTGFLLQHTGAADGPDVTARHPVATLRSLLASRAWLLGLVLATFGWALHVGALSRAPLSLVQAFVAGGLVLAVPIGRGVFKQSLGRSELAGICVAAAALAALAVGIHDSGAHGGFGSLRLGLYLAASVVGAAVLVSAPGGARRPHALGAAGGLLYGSADVAIKALTGIDSRHGVGAALLTPWFPFALLATASAFFCFQRALQTGRALPVIALMTAATNALSIVAGFAVFGDPIGHTPGLAVLHAGALALVVGAASLLAPAGSSAAQVT